MRREALEVARERPREGEEAHGHDGTRERQDRRVLGGAGDQVARRSPSGRCRRSRRAHRARSRARAARAAPGQGRRVCGAFASWRRRDLARSATRPSSRRIVRSARVTSSGRCAMTSRVRPSPSRSIASVDGCGVLGIEVGSRLVEDDERGVPKERPREGDALPLSRRDRPSAVARRPSRSRRAARE